MSKKEIPEILTIPGLRNGYETGSFSPRDVVKSVIERSAALAEKHIFITLPSMELIGPHLAELPPIDFKKYPLWGIPFAIKDNIDLAGAETTAACPAYAYQPEESATVVKKLLAAGAIPIGKTNLDQFATGLVGTRSPYGEVENAYVPERISGGSSSGSAVSVACGLAAFALGTDTAGSGRVPAMLNAIVGWKPALGAWSTKGVVPACASLDCVTVFAHTLGEAETVDSIARGYDAACRWSRPLVRKAAALPKKILLPADGLQFFGQTAQVMERKWQRAAERLETLGVPVESISIDIFEHAAKLLYEGAFVAERWADLGAFVEAHPGEIFSVTETILRTGGKALYTAAKLFDDMHALALDRHRAAELLEDAVLALPTAGGTFTRAEVDDDPVRTNSLMGLYTNHCNLLDLAAIAVPEDADDHEDPFGITLFALHENEHLADGVARAFLAAGGTQAERAMEPAAKEASA